MAAKEHHKNQNPECWWMYKKQCANINIFFHFGTIAFKSATREVCVSLIWLSCECKCPVLHSYKIDAVVPKTFQHENVSFGLKDSGSSFQNSIAETGTADVLWKTNVKCWFVEISDKWRGITRSWGEVFDQNGRQHFQGCLDRHLGWRGYLYSGSQHLNLNVRLQCPIHCTDQVAV